MKMTTLWWVIGLIGFNVKIYSVTGGSFSMKLFTLEPSNRQIPILSRN